MKIKTLSIVVALLALVSAIVFFANRPAATSNADPRVGAPLVTRTELEKASKIRFSDQGKTVLIEKRADGTWIVPDYYGFPADFSKITSLVDELQHAKVDRFVSANPERLARFEFKDSQIALLDAEGKELWSLTLGKTAEGGGKLLRFGSEQRAYLGRLSTYLDVEARNWADSSLAKLKPEEVASVSFALEKGQQLTVKRAKKEEAFSAEKTPEGKQLKVSKVSSLLSTLSFMRFSDTSAPDAPEVAEAKKHLRSVEVTTFDGAKLNVAFGRKPEQKIPKKVAANNEAKTEQTKAPEKEGEKQDPAKPNEPEFETIPAGPVFAFVSSSDPKAPVNEMSKKRAFQVYETNYTSIPDSLDELFEAAPAKEAPAAPKPTAETTKN